MAKPPEFNARKLAGPELAEFAKQPAASALSVIIELPGTAQVEFTEPKSDGDARRPFAVLPVDEEAERQRMDDLERELIKLVGEKPVRLDAAQAFVLDVTPEQLRAASLLDNVGLVRPNRTHHAPG